MAVTSIGATIDDSQPTKGGKKKGDPKGQRDATRKFYSSKKYAKDAAYIFRAIPNPIWIIPAWNKEMSLDAPRQRFIPLPQVEDKILQSGADLTPEERREGIRPGEQNEAARRQRIRGHLAGGGTIIISAGASITRGNMPTPWALLHNMFHADGPSRDFQRDFIGPAVWAIRDWIWEESDRIERMIEDTLRTRGEEPGRDRLGLIASDRKRKTNRDFYPVRNREFAALLIASMTMGSARAVQTKGGEFAHSEIVHEALTQALTHSRGFHLNRAGLSDRLAALWGDDLYGAPRDPAISQAIEETLQRLEDFVNAQRDSIIGEMSRLLRGKILWVAASAIPYALSPDLKARRRG
jgi:hypothetical protein